MRDHKATLCCLNSPTWLFLCPRFSAVVDKLPNLVFKKERLLGSLQQSFPVISPWVALCQKE